MLNDDIVPSQPLDVQVGAAKCGADRVESEHSARLEVDDLGGPIVAYEIGARERAEHWGARLKFDLHLGFSARAVAPLIGDEDEQLFDIMVADPREEEA